MKLIKPWKIAFLVLLIIIIDQIIKYIVFKYGYEHDVNRSLIWGLVDDKFLVLSLHLLTIIFIGKIYLKLYQTKHISEVVFLSLIIAGGLSNFFDRIFYSGVVDYIKFSIIPIFNIADISISCGLSFLLVRHLLLRKRYL